MRKPTKRVAFRLAAVSGLAILTDLTFRQKGSLSFQGIQSHCSQPDELAIALDRREQRAGDRAGPLDARARRGDSWTDGLRRAEAGTKDHRVEHESRGAERRCAEHRARGEQDDLSPSQRFACDVGGICQAMGGLGPE